MKTLKSFRTLLILSVSVILLNSCFSTGDEPLCFHVIKFTKPGYAQYVRGTKTGIDSDIPMDGLSDTVIHMYRYNVPEYGMTDDHRCCHYDWMDYAFYPFFPINFNEFDAADHLVPLHDGYYLEYPYLTFGRVIYNLKWTDLTSFDIDLSDYKVLADTGLVEGYEIRPPKTVKDMAGVIEYANKRIDKGDLHRNDRINWESQYQ